MKAKIYFVSLLVIFSLVLSACGPSPEEIATMTAASWTATPPPTATPTPVPYNLTVSVSDEQGDPLAEANVAISESGESLLTDASGMASFSDLPGETVTLDVTAPGYFGAQSSQNLQRGTNQASVTLTRDPNGMPLAEACLPGETSVYLDDFQDGGAAGWDAVEFGMSGWNLGAAPDDEQNMVMTAAELTPNEAANFSEVLPENFVWRVKFMVTGEGEYHFSTNQSGGYAVEGQTVDNSNYTLILGTQPGGEGPRTSAMLRFQDPLVEMIITNRWEGKIYPGVWHYLQISNYQGEVQVWLDGEQIIAYSDPQPLPPGNLVLGNSNLQGGAEIHFDNMAICQLNAPFEPMPKPLSGYEVQVLVADTEGTPLPGAALVLQEMGDMPGSQATTDAEGKAAMGDLPGSTFTLFVSAPGYHAQEISLSIEKGTPLVVNISLEADPFALLPEKACAAGETLAYIEDYQDGHAQGWNGFEQSAPGLSLTAAPDSEGNIVAAMQYNGSGEGFADRLENGQTFIDAVWRFFFLPSGRFAPGSGGSFNWLGNLQPYDQDGTEVFDSRYQIPFGSNPFELRRLQQPVSNLGLASGLRTPKPGEWNFIEISTFQGLTQVWLNGVKVISYQDPNPLPPGTIGLEAWLLRDTDPILYFDNMAVCELSAPFATLFTEE